MKRVKVQMGCISIFVMMLIVKSAVAEQENEKVVEEIETLIRTELQRQQIPGMAVGVITNDGIIVAKGFGLANLEHQVPVTDETVFQTGSTGKQFTAAAIMLMVEDGKIGLNDSITYYFNDAPPSWRPITVRQLLTHTSGIKNYSRDDLDYRGDYTEDDLTKIAYGLPLDFPAGSDWSYSNTGYVLLGILIHKVSGKHYSEVLKARIFEPTGMESARLISEADIVRNRAAGYRLINGKLKNQEWVSPSLLTTADGSLYLSVNDFIAWGQALRKNEILTPKSWSEVYKPVELDSGGTYPYGFGWRIDKVNDHTRYYHSGSWQGFQSYITRFPGFGVTIIVLSNLADSEPSEVANGIAKIIDPELSARKAD